MTRTLDFIWNLVRINDKSWGQGNDMLNIKRLLLREQTIEEKRGNKKNRQEAVEIVHKRGAAAWDSHAGGGYDVK